MSLLRLRDQSDGKGRQLSAISLLYFAHSSRRPVSSGSSRAAFMYAKMISRGFMDSNEQSSLQDTVQARLNSAGTRKFQQFRRELYAERNGAFPLYSLVYRESRATPAR